MAKDLSEPDGRVIRPNEAVPFRDLCIPLDRCVCVQPGLIEEAVLSKLQEHDYDEAPVYDPITHRLWGLVATNYLAELRDHGLELNGDDPKVSGEGNFFHIGHFTPIYPLLHRLQTYRAVIVVRAKEDAVYGDVEFIIGLFSISDLNRQAVRALIYRLFAEVEAGLAVLLERNVADHWIWLSALSEESQARIIGYWEIAKRKGVDIGPISALNLAQLINVIARFKNLLSLLGFDSRKDFESRTGHIPEFRNRIMHPVRPLVLGQEDVRKLYQAARSLEQLREVLEAEGVCLGGA